MLTYICKFIDTGFETVASTSNIRRGSLKDRYAKEVKGVGCIGDYYGNPSNNPFYITWMNMLARTHGMSVGNGAEVYENATMCDRWLNFTNFVEDMGTLVGNDDRVKYKYVKFDIDKDIFLHGNKHYSSNTCCFIPSKLNTFFINKQKTNSTGYEGVGRHNGSFRARVQADGVSVYIGGFETASEAYVEYNREKKCLLDFYLKYEFSYIDERIKNAMYKKLDAQFNETIQNNQRGDY